MCEEGSRYMNWGEKIHLHSLGQYSMGWAVHWIRRRKWAKCEHLTFSACECRWDGVSSLELLRPCPPSMRDYIPPTEGQESTLLFFSGFYLVSYPNSIGSNWYNDSHSQFVLPSPREFRTMSLWTLIWISLLSHSTLIKLGHYFLLFLFLISSLSIPTSPEPLFLGNPMTEVSRRQPLILVFSQCSH